MPFFTFFRYRDIAKTRRKLATENTEVTEIFNIFRHRFKNFTTKNTKKNQAQKHKDFDAD